MKMCVFIHLSLNYLLTLPFSQPRFRLSRWYTGFQALYARLLYVTQTT